MCMISADVTCFGTYRKNTANIKWNVPSTFIHAEKAIRFFMFLETDCFRSHIDAL